LLQEDFNEFGISETVLEKKMEREISVYPWRRRTIRYPLASVNREIFDEHLAMSAQHAGVDLMMSCRALDVKWRRSGDVEVITDSDGAMRTFGTKLVIFADGVNTLACRTMGIGFRRRSQNMAFGLVYEFEAPDNHLTDYFIFFNPKGLTRCGYSWVIPKKNTLNVGVYLFDKEYRTHLRKKGIMEDSGNREDSEFWQLIRGKKVLSKQGAYLPLKVPAHLCSDSALTVGDAAGLVSPLTGAGIHLALYSGRLAGLVADRALAKEDYSQNELHEYAKTLREYAPCRNMEKESLIFKFCRITAPLDPNMYSKLFHLYKIRRDFSLLDNLKVASFPFLSCIQQGFLR
jgi:flavin-dependent dehydrogenase